MKWCDDGDVKVISKQRGEENITDDFEVKSNFKTSTFTQETESAEIDNDVKIVGLSQLREVGRIYYCCVDDFGDSNDEESKYPGLHSHEGNINLAPKSKTTVTSINKCSGVLSSEAL